MRLILKKKKKNQKTKLRKEKIIEFVRTNPYCSKDKIFTNGKIPKSKKTINLLKNLVSQNKIHVAGLEKKRYFVGDPDFFKEFKLFYKDLVCKSKKYPNDPKYNDKFARKLIEYAKTRIKVLEAEKRIHREVNLDDTLNMWFNFIIPFLQNENKLSEINIIDFLNWSIIDDKYYLKHQLHSYPRERGYIFNKSKTVYQRRSLRDLLDMKEKGRQEFGISRSAYRKHMDKLTDNPNRWFDRFFSEKNRTLYNNPPELQRKIHKKILYSIKLNPKDPQYEIKKKLLDAEKKSFPYVPIETIMEILPDKDKKIVREVFEESGMDYDSVLAKYKKRKILWSPSYIKEE